MAVQCANCGEALLGAVNRCWRCGQLLTPHDGPSDIPPVRRSPITEPLDAAAVEAVIIESDQAPSGIRSVMRKGSPFASATRDGRKNEGTRRRQPDSQRPKVLSSYAAPRVSGAVSVPLGVLSLAMARPFPAGSLTIAVAAIAFGIWGLYCPKHVLGTTGVVIGCIALALAAFFGTVELYEYLYGVNPFSATTPPPMVNP